MSQTVKEVDYIECQKGHFYTIGVGPGSPEYLTLKALGLIQTADLIIAPKSTISSESIALEVVRPFLREGQEIYEHIYSMSRNEEETLNSWSTVADLVCDRISKGDSVVHITIGDPLIYSTAHYLLELFETRLTEDQVTVVPGISAFQTIASKFKRSITIQEGRVILMTATDIERVRLALLNAETVILYKAGRHLEKLLDLLTELKLVDAAKLVTYADHSGRERIIHNLKDIKSEHPGYMATMIIYKGCLKWS